MWKRHEYGWPSLVEIVCETGIVITSTRLALQKLSQNHSLSLGNTGVNINTGKTWGYGIYNIPSHKGWVSSLRPGKLYSSLYIVYIYDKRNVHTV
jgi:hypothetical protein